MLRPTLLRAAALFMSSEVAAWWLVGDLSEPSPSPDYLMYSFRAPDLSSAVTASAGVVGVALTLTLGWPLVRTRATHRSAIVLAACGAAVAWCARVMTAGVHGANIGAGLIMIFVAPLLAAVTAVTFARLAWVSRQ